MKFKRGDKVIVSKCALGKITNIKLYNYIVTLTNQYHADWTNVSIAVPFNDVIADSPAARILYLKSKF